MSKQRIIITLSADNIALAYVKGDGSRLPEPFPGSVWPMTLRAFGGGAASSPNFRIGKSLDERVRYLFDEGLLLDDDGEAGYKNSLEVLLLTENDLTDADIDNAKADLERWGFKNLRLMHPDIAVTEFYCSENDYQGLVIASSNGKDLSVSLYSIDKPLEFQRYNLPGMACDNRVEAVAEKIWELVKDNTLGLTYSTEAPALRKVAQDFLKTNENELEGPVRLSDNNSYDFFLMRSSLRSLSQTDGSLQAKFTDILLDNDMSDRSTLALVLRNDAVGNLYLKEMLTEAFAKVEEDTASLRDAVAGHIAGKDWDTIGERIVIKSSALQGRPVFYKTNVRKVEESKESEEEKVEKIEPLPPEPKIHKRIPVNIDAKVSTVKKSFFKKQSVLKIIVDIPDCQNLPWKSVLCVQEDPLSVVDRRYVVREYPREERPPFALDLDLPLKSSPNARKLRIYFLPDPDEPVGINNVYEFEPVTVKLD